MSEFVWTDYLVGEFVGGMDVPCSPSMISMCLEKFKESKQPKPEWEILKGMSSYGDIHEWISEDRPTGMKKCTSCSIYQVKRLSDGEVFTVGDIVAVSGLSRSKPIKGFKVQMGAQKALVCFHDDSDTYLDYIRQAKEKDIPVLLPPSQIDKLIKLLNE